MTSICAALLCVSAFAILSGCGGTTTSHSADAEFARTIATIAAEAAVAKPGVKVCKTMHVGISERDWIRGTVMEAVSGRIGVRIDDIGRHPHTLNGVVVARGAVLWDAPLAWVPCI